MPRPLEEQVSAGIALLDRLEPGWRNRINLNKLDMIEPDQCILGQLYGDYEKGIKVVLPHAYLPNAEWLHEITPYGFTVYPEGRGTEMFDDLTQEWKLQLAA